MFSIKVMRLYVSKPHDQGVRANFDHFHFLSDTQKKTSRGKSVRQQIEGLFLKVIKLV